MEKVWFSHYPKGVPHDIDLNRYESVYDIYAQAVQRYKDLPAFSNMGVTYSFAEIDALVNQFASFLQHELNLKKGDRIAIQMPNLLQFPVAAFAALKLGLIVVNTNPLYTAHEMHHQFRDSGAKAIVILANFAHLLEKILPETKIEAVIITQLGDLFPAPKKWIVNAAVRYIKKMVPPYKIPNAFTFQQALTLGSVRPATEVPLAMEDIAFLQYTGGTTGVAKGAVLTHRNIVANVMQISAWMTPLLSEGKEIALAALPMYHIFSLTVNCLAFLEYGAHNILITNPRDIPGFLKEMKKYPFTIMSGVNTLFNALMNHPEFTTVDFTTVKISVAGAMALQKSVFEKWFELTKTWVVEGYGLTEASPVVCVNPIDGKHRVGTIGLPVPSTDVKLIDDDGKEVPVGQPGELCCAGPQVMQGYWQRPDETAQVIDNGWLKTGDIAVADADGFFKIVDRKKDLILVSGFNVYPNEVEEAIASHPGVLEVAAIGIPNEHSGELVKAVVVRKNSALTAEDIIAHAKLTLTNYKVPKVVEFRDELPKTNVGKILRRALRG